MPFIDYLTLLLANMGAGLVVLAFFFLRGYGTANERPWASGLAMAGLVAFAGGLYMVLTWPITEMKGNDLRWADCAYGESTVLLGIAFLGAALTVSRGWSLVPVTIYATVAGGVAILLGVRIYDLGLSASPPMTAAGFILTGLAGPLSLWVTLARGRMLPKVLAAVVLLAAAGLWLFTAAMSYWGHLGALSHKAAA